MKQTKQQLVELVTDLQSKLQLANEQHDNVVDELNKLRSEHSNCVPSDKYKSLQDEYKTKLIDYNEAIANYNKKKGDLDSLHYKHTSALRDIASKDKEIETLGDQIRKLEHDHAGCITREQYGKLEVQLASANEELDKWKETSVSFDAYEDACDSIKTLRGQVNSYAASNVDLYQEVADMSKHNKWLKISLVTSVVMLIASLI
ncbi:MAG: hypothetical protein ACRCXT_04945 [Paraclostridium sp.]